MTYSEMLTTMIISSELSLRQLCKRCADFRLSITPSYISQLKNGKLPPPNADVSLILAKACGAPNEAQLVFQGYMEKAPAIIREYMLASSQMNKIMLESLCKTQADSSATKGAMEFLNKLDVISTLDLTSKYVKDGEFNPPEDLVKQLTLSSGGNVASSEQKDIINMFIGDASMTPTIPIHAFIYILPTPPSLLKDRDIIAFNPNSRKMATLRRVFLHHDEILLIPDDRSADIFTVNSFEELDYIGKVVSYKINI